ncbi:MAG TPA: TlyA family RNA methyltransferase [Actinomycetota bacterium]|nr:TlyA family RNA methyltransferase [Actinomycetota bacterium]
MSKPARLDAELVRRGLAGSRAEAKTAIEQGKVAVRGVPASRATTLVSPADPITLSAPAARFVSRGGEKLDGALARLDVEVAGRRWLDAGASTGGFTDRLLQGGAAAVVAADVGYGQLDWRLRNDERVVVIERLNLRELTRDRLPWPPEGVVADLSFISLRLVLPALVGAALEAADFVVLVKPQFEVGRDGVGKGGVVRDPGLWAASMRGVADAAAALGLAVAGAVPSPVPGPAGNREFFLHLRAGGNAGDDAIVAAASEVAP